MIKLITYDKISKKYKAAIILSNNLVVERDCDTLEDAKQKLIWADLTVRFVN